MNESAAEQLNEIFERDEGGADLIPVLAQQLLADYAERGYELAEMRGNYEGACRTIAAMHKAAVGEVRGPNRGVVQDVEDLSSRCDAAEKALDKTLDDLLIAREQFTGEREKRRRDYSIVGDRLKAAETRAANAEKQLQEVREHGWKQEWNGRERVMAQEVLVERAEPGSQWPRVTVDGLTLPWYFQSTSVNDISNLEIATVTLVLEASLVVQSNAMPVMGEGDMDMREREETVIARVHQATAKPVEPAAVDSAAPECQ